jgi:hypothetical protein
MVGKESKPTNQPTQCSTVHWLVKKFPTFYEKPKAHHQHSEEPVNRILSQINPDHTFPAYFFKIHFNF